MNYWSVVTGPLTATHYCLAATWIGGGFIVGTAEAIYDPTKGLIWALIPLQCSVSFVIG